MSDTTTEGYTVSAAEIDGMVRNLCAYALSELDPVQRYIDLTHQQVLFQGMVEAIQRARGRAIADVLVAGMSADEIVSKTNLTTPLQVTKLVKAAGDVERVKAATKPAKAVKPPKAVKAAKGGGRSAAMLPPVAAAPGERRVLTAEERAALGLPALKAPASPSAPAKPAVPTKPVAPAKQAAPAHQTALAQQAALAQQVAGPAPKAKEAPSGKDAPRVKKGLLRKKRTD
jgi:hypothetical protein